METKLDIKYCLVDLVDLKHLIAEVENLKQEVAELKKGRIANDRLLTLKQTMQMLGVTDDTLRAWHNTGKLKHRKASDKARRVFWLESEVLNLKTVS